MSTRTKADRHGLAPSSARSSSAARRASDAWYEQWSGQAACREEDPELFFPARHDGPGVAQIREAKAICRRCPVVEDCHAWALSTDQEYGVWGGMSERERRGRRERRKPNGRPPAPCGTESAYQRHLRSSEQIDEACRAAHRDHRTAARARAKAAQGRP
ncbi:hypothetical protein CTZ27_37070 [Streptomyces griseocarneus]|nr:hypothetical protein CTZ27_37070 [Streptomyces griseocarneus]